MPDILQQLSSSRREGKPTGIYSVCSAHPWVIEAAIDQAIEDESSLLIEATCNQVNHQGGYTGMLPSDFIHLVQHIASRRGLPMDKLIFGGDHLGPNPWRSRSSGEAMREACTMVKAYVEAGFHKVHLDASMACADDTAPLSNEVIARRAAELCAVAEQHSGAHKPVYVIGTEVPVPGGATESLAELAVTTREAAEETLHIHRRVFRDHGLEDAWTRVIALVVQPGVEFNHDSVVDYDPRLTVSLTGLLDHENIVFEAHSTDYQRPESYQNLVQDGFAILKVGPALTFAMREALFALESIEAELFSSQEHSNLQAVLEQTMMDDPVHWAGHYHGDASSQHLLRKYSYSDRVRYYWGYPRVQQAVARLVSNLDAVSIPETMLSAWLPNQYRCIRNGRLQPNATAIILHRIREALAPYAAACAPHQRGALQI